MSKHTLSVLVENKPGVLARIAGLFSRRGFNIDSLAVGPTEHPEISRMTVVVDVEELPLEQVTKQLNKLVKVLKIVELDRPASVQRELLLVKVRADLHHPLATSWRPCSCSAPRSSTSSPDAVVIEATGNARQARGAAARCWSRSASRSSCSPAWSPSAAAPRSITDRALRSA